jgi:hypothetical protein
VLAGDRDGKEMWGREPRFNVSMTSDRWSGVFATQTRVVLSARYKERLRRHWCCHSMMPVAFTSDRRSPRRNRGRSARRSLMANEQTRSYPGYGRCQVSGGKTRRGCTFPNEGGTGGASDLARGRARRPFLAPIWGGHALIGQKRPNINTT